MTQLKNIALTELMNMCLKPLLLIKYLKAKIFFYL